MAREIWKQPLPIQQTGHDHFVLRAPNITKVLHVGMQNGTPHVWFELDDNAPARETIVFIVGTGNRFTEAGEYVGSVMDGFYVWHVYARIGANV